MIISWSFLRAFEKCPLQQKLIRIDKVGPKKIDERRFITGSVGHRFFEIWAKRRFDDGFDSSTAGKILDEMIPGKHIQWYDDSDYDRVRKRVIKEAKLLIEAVHHHEIDKIDNLQTEVYLQKDLSDGRNSIAGIIDVIANNGSWIIDLKMSADSKWADPGQLIFYGLLFGMIKGRFPNRLSFFLPLMSDVKDRLLDIEVSNNDILEMYERIQNLIESWNKGYFQAKGDAETCRYCNVHKHCNQFEYLNIKKEENYVTT